MTKGVNTEMNDEKKKTTVGFAVTASYCTFSKIFDALPKLCEKYNVIPIVSYNTQSFDTRFIKAADTLKKLEEITGNTCIRTMTEAEPIGPKALLDLLVIAPCTGNTLGKISSGIYDTPVTLAYKSHMRNNRPVLIAVSTNDGLSGSAVSIGKLLNTRNVFFVPFGQDDPIAKERSLVADFSKLPLACEAALLNRQLHPILL